AAEIHAFPKPIPSWPARPSPNASVPSAPAITSVTATRVTRRRSAISLGRSRFSAAIWRMPAATAPATRTKANSRWRKSSVCVTGGAYCHNQTVDVRERHLRLLTETIEAVNSTLDLAEVLFLVARKVADALGADACFVYLYDERADELVLRATHGTSVDEMTRRPRMRPGDGITGVAAAERAPVMIPSAAHLDPRFKEFPHRPE